MFAEDHVAQSVLGCAPTDRSWVRHTIAPPNLREVDLHWEELTAIGKPDLTVNLLKTEHLFGYPFFLFRPSINFHNEWTIQESF